MGSWMKWKWWDDPNEPGLTKFLWQLCGVIVGIVLILGAQFLRYLGLI